MTMRLDVCMYEKETVAFLLRCCRRNSDLKNEVEFYHALTLALCMYVHFVKII